VGPESPADSHLTLIGTEPVEPERAIRLQRRAYAIEQLTKQVCSRGESEVSIEVRGDQFGLRYGR
jgi:hypothetical protein